MPLRKKPQHNLPWFIERAKTLTPGKHSVPLIVKRGQKKFVFKRSSLGQSLSLEEAKMMASAVKDYRSNLHKAGINVSKVNMVAPVRDYSVKGNKYFVASLEEFINPNNIEQTLTKSSKKVAQTVFSKLVKEVNKAAKVKGRNKFKTGLPMDTKPKNYVLGKDGKVYFIDFYSPKLMDSKGIIHPYITRLHKTRTRNNLQQRFEDKRAMFHILLAESIATRPDLRRQFEQITFDFLEKQGATEILEYLKLATKQDYVRPALVKTETINLIKGR
jgi:hypothetical protein